ncbi:hypothetical protein BHE74_00024246, partial [Ensete ventricosum]
QLLLHLQRRWSETKFHSEHKCFLVSCSGGQSQLVCSGCRNLLLYPQGAKSVCCAVCRAVTTVPPPEMFEFAAGTEMAQLICGGCHTLLMYIRGASSVQCSCCHTVNLALEGKQVLLIKK